jgi:hypothetical protein
MHRITGALGPSRVFCSGGLRYWEDGREIPDVMVAVFDYPALGSRPGFNLTLKVNFVDASVGGGFGGTGFRFVGNEGAMDLGRTLTLKQRPPLPSDWDAPRSRDVSLTEGTQHTYEAPFRYDARLDHFRNFFEAVRTRKPVVEDGLFGLRAAAPALLCNQSYFERKTVSWDPETFEVTTA